MAEKRLTHTITVDLAKETWSSRPVLVQNSDNTFLITVLNDGEPADLSDVRDIVLAAIPSRKKANDSVFSAGVKVGSTSQVKIDLGRAAVATPGIVQAQLKLTGTNGGLISSTSFNFEVQMDAGLNFQPSENELTLIETVLGDGPTVLAYATQTIADMESTQATLTGAVGGAISSLNEDKAAAIEELDTAKTTAVNELAEVREANRFRQLNAVTTVAERDSTYPNPEHGDTVRVTSDATMYKYDKDAGWVVSDRYEATAVDALNQQLADTDAVAVSANQKATVLNEFTEFGKIPLPSDFPGALPFEIFRDLDGLFKHNFRFNDITDGLPSVYINESTGLDGRDGLTVETAVKTLTRALEIAESMPEETVNIFFTEKWAQYFLTAPYVQDQVFTINKNINLRSTHPGGSIVYNGNEPNTYAWAESSGAYSTARSATTYVADYKFKGFRGLPVLYRKTSSLTECRNTPGTWFGNTTTTYVHRLDSSIPDDDVCIMLPYENSIKFNIHGKRLFIDGVSFWMDKYNSTSSVVTIEGDDNSTFISRRASTAFGNTNGWAFKSVGRTMSFESEALFTGSDGFNYHGKPGNLAVEFYCYSHDNGQKLNGTSNATTAHDGMYVVRIGSIGHDAKGPVLADVNGCFSVNIGCTMYNSLRSAGNPKAAFYFDNTAATTPGKAWLIECGGGGKDTFTVNTDAGFNLVVKRLKGNNIPTGLNITQMA